MNGKAFIAIATSALVGACGGSKQAERPQTARSPDQGMACAANVAGAQFSAQETPGGASLVFRSTNDGQVEMLRSYARLRVSNDDSQARASGGAPMGQTAQLPPVVASVDEQEGGAIITYTATNPANIERVRELVKWDADVQNRGYCSRLRSPEGGFSAAAPATSPPAQLSITVTGVEIERPLVEQCGIQAPAAFFAFDSADLRPTAYPVMSSVARCVTDGPLAGGKLQVTGHADPRGTDEYNLQLGKDRAQSVADHLTSIGIPKDRIEVISKGEQDAKGTDPYGWSLDRRVNIRLAR